MKRLQVKEQLENIKIAANAKPDINRQNNRQQMLQNLMQNQDGDKQQQYEKIDMDQLINDELKKKFFLEKKVLVEDPKVPEEIQVKQEDDQEIKLKIGFAESYIRKNKITVQTPQINFEQLSKNIICFSPTEPKLSSRENQKNIIANFKSKKNEHFIDEIFPPNLSAIVNQSIKQKNNPELQCFLNWNPIKKIYPKDHLFVTKFVDPLDLKAGKSEQYSNKHILCSLSALADNPDNIFYLLEDQKYNDNGIYYIKINKHGQWQYILIDDFFPFHQENQQQKQQIIQQQKEKLEKHEKPSTQQVNIQNSLICARENDNIWQGAQDIEIWQNLLEKALVKAYGTYEDINNSETPLKDILRDLTGGAVIEYSTDQGDIAQIISNAIENKFIVITQSSNEEQQKLQSEFGFDARFSFQVIKVKENLVLEVRNQWGHLPNQNNKIDIYGVCEINIFDFQRCFPSILIVHTYNFQNVYMSYTLSQKVDFKSNFHAIYSILVFQLDLDVQSPCFFECIQQDKRLFKRNAQGYQYSPVRLFLFKDQKGYQEGAFSLANRTTTIQLQQITAGKYYLVALIDYNCQLTRPIPLTFSFLCKEQHIQKQLEEISSEEININKKQQKNIVGSKENIQQEQQLLNARVLRFQREHLQKNVRFLNEQFIQDVLEKGLQNTTNKQCKELLLLLETEKVVVLALQNNTQNPVTIQKDFSNIKQAKLLDLSNIVDFNSEQIKTQDSFKQTYQLAKDQIIIEIFLLEPQVQITIKTLKELGFK